MHDGIEEENHRLVQQALHLVETYQGKDATSWAAAAGFLAEEVIRLRQENQRQVNILHKHGLLPSATTATQGEEPLDF